MPDQVKDDRGIVHMLEEVKAMQNIVKDFIASVITGGGAADAAEAPVGEKEVGGNMTSRIQSNEPVLLPIDSKYKLPKKNEEELAPAEAEAARAAEEAARAAEEAAPAEEEQRVEEEEVGGNMTSRIQSNEPVLLPIEPKYTLPKKNEEKLAPAAEEEAEEEEKSFFERLAEKKKASEERLQAKIRTRAEKNSGLKTPLLRQSDTDDSGTDEDEFFNASRTERKQMSSPTMTLPSVTRNSKPDEVNRALNFKNIGQKEEKEEEEEEEAAEAEAPAEEEEVVEEIEPLGDLPDGVGDSLDDAAWGKLIDTSDTAENQMRSKASKGIAGKALNQAIESLTPPTDRQSPANVIGQGDIAPRRLNFGNGETPQTQPQRARSLPPSKSREKQKNNLTRSKTVMDRIREAKAPAPVPAKYIKLKF